MTNTQHMQPRLDYAKAAPGAREAMYAVERYVRECGLERRLLELVKLRASQINGCAYCVDMHTKDARANGDTEQRLYAVVVWREAPFFTERERAALAWTESVTLVSPDRVPETLFCRVGQPSGGMRADPQRRTPWLGHPGLQFARHRT